MWGWQREWSPQQSFISFGLAFHLFSKFIDFIWKFTLSQNFEFEFHQCILTQSQICLTLWRCCLKFCFCEMTLTLSFETHRCKLGGPDTPLSIHSDCGAPRLWCPACRPQCHKAVCPGPSWTSSASTPRPGNTNVKGEETLGADGKPPRPLFANSRCCSSSSAFHTQETSCNNSNSSPRI